MPAFRMLYRSAFCVSLSYAAACTSLQPEFSSSPSTELARALSVQVEGAPVIGSSAVVGMERVPGGLTPRFADGAPTWQSYVATTLPTLGDGELLLSSRPRADMRIAVSLKGARSVAALVQDGYVVYENVLPGATSVHRATWWSDEDYMYYAAKPADESLSYTVSLLQGVASLRSVGETVEFLDENGVPALRMATPYAVTAQGTRFRPEVNIAKCNYSSDPNPRVKSEDATIGSGTCEIRLRWNQPESSYPLLVDPEWGASSQLPTGFLRGSPQIHRLSTGGVLATGNSTNPSQIWSGTSGTWSATGTSAVVMDANSAKSVTLNDGSVLMFSGVNGGAALNSVQRFDPTTGLWSTKANLPVALHRPAGLTLTNGKVLVAGGGTGNLGTVYSAAYAYDTATNLWSSAGDMGVLRRDATLINITSNKALIVGGTNNSSCTGALATSQVYNTSSGNWASSTGIPFSVVNPNLLMLSNGKVLMAGSFCNVNPTALYTVGGGSWAGGNNLNNPMTNMSGQGLAEQAGIAYGPSASSVFPNQYNVATTNIGTGLQAPQALADSSLLALPSGGILAVAGNGSNLTQLLSICGDGVKNTGETCDDGNTVSGDGCSSACAIEAGYQCRRPNLVSNGDFEFPLVSSGNSTVYAAGASLAAPGGAWTVGGTNVKINDSFVSTPSNYQALDLNGTSTGSISQTIGTIAGHNYVWQARASADTACGAGNRSAALAVTSGASAFTWSIRTSSAAISSPWDLYTGNFAAAAASTSVVFTSSEPTGNCGIMLDDIQVYDVTTLGCVTTCGNGALDTGEACDDGNAVSGDGCSSACAIEANYQCSKPSVLFNGETEQPARPGNNCASYGTGDTTVTGWTVFGVDIQHCYNNGWTAPSYHNYIELNSSSQGGITSQNFNTIAGHTYAWEARVATHAGCGPNLKTGYIAVQSGNQSFTSPFSSSVDGTLQGGGGTWDRTSGSFVAASTTGAFSAYSTTQGNCGPTIDAMRLYDITAGTCFATCGNGVVEAGETCDDGNLVTGDGCSSACAIEAGQSCPTATNLVTNGGFEAPAVGAGGLQNISAGSSAITGWTINSGDVEVQNGFSGSVAPQGSNYIDTAGSFNVRMTQTLSGLTPGVSYAWSVRAASYNGSGSTGQGLFSMQTAVSNNLSTFINTTVNSNTTAWASATGRWTPATSSATVEIQGLSSGNTSVYMDDVRLQKIQSCTCDGNYGTGMPNACAASNPVCFATGLCGADAHAGCS